MKSIFLQKYRDAVTFGIRQEQKNRNPLMVLIEWDNQTSAGKEFQTVMNIT